MRTPMGVYSSSSAGFKIARKKVAEFISRRDNVIANESHIYMTNGASEGCVLGLRLAVRNEKDAVLLPIPQYPLYSAMMQLMNGKVLPYYLNEETDWSLKVEDIQMQIDMAKKQGITTRAIVVINPGNPTGQVVSEENIRSIIELCARENIMILADEVYQENIWDKNLKFHSFRKVLETMPPQIANSVELLSVHSISKGMSGECGLRGGYFETQNFLPEIEEVIAKLKAVELCANTVGQIACTLMVDPP